MLNSDEINRLKKLAARDCLSDDEDAIIDDFAGGNVDDAFSLGVSEGETLLARNVLSSLGIKW